MFPSMLLWQKVEILSSDPETSTAHNDDDDDSDFEETSSTSRRKRTKAHNGQGKNKQPRPSNHIPDSSGSGNPSRRAQEAAPLDGTLEVQKQEGQSASMSGTGRSSVFSGRASPTGGASSTAAFSASSFDLQENTKRRNAFQAGLKAALPDDEIPSATKARGVGSGLAVDSEEGGAGAGGAHSERSGTTSCSRGKGKGATTGRVKLTPMEQQVVDLKAKHPGVLLLVECGYRYRFFGEDALAAAKVSIALSDVRDAIREFCLPKQGQGNRPASVLRTNPGACGRVGDGFAVFSVSTDVPVRRKAIRRS